MEFFVPSENANGTAVIVCPGGGYNILAYQHEGIDVCKWLNSIGVTGILLKYRVPRRKNRAKHEAPLQDAQRSIGLVRQQAKNGILIQIRLAYSDSPLVVILQSWHQLLIKKDYMIKLIQQT